MATTIEHSDPCGERIEICLDDASHAALMTLTNSGSVTHYDFSNVASFLARNPKVGKNLSDRSGHHPLLAALDLVTKWRRVEDDPIVQRLNADFSTGDDVSAAESFLEATAGNFAPLQARLCARKAVKTFDLAAIAEIFSKSQRSIDAILPSLLPRRSQQRAALLGHAFGLPALSPAELSRAFARYRRPTRRSGSWKTHYGQSKVASDYQRLRRTMGRGEAMDAVAGLAHRRFRPSEKTIEAAVTASRKRRDPGRPRAEIHAVLKIYLVYRRLANPQIS